VYPAPVIWHVTIDGAPACTAGLLTPEERLDFPLCGSRNRQRVEEYAGMLRARHSGAEIQVLPGGCDVRGE
jgi:hypothetical protein